MNPFHRLWRNLRQQDLVESLQIQIDGMQEQVSHAATATNVGADHVKKIEREMASLRHSITEERRRNRSLPGYQVVPEDFDPVLNPYHYQQTLR